MDDGARVLMLSYPNNPTGAVLAKDTMQQVVEYAVAHDQLIISDEVYAELNYHGEHVSAAAVPGAREHVLLVGGFSKAWAMTGWRLGFAGRPGGDHRGHDEAARLHRHVPADHGPRGRGGGLAPAATRTCGPCSGSTTSAAAWW